MSGLSTLAVSSQVLATFHLKPATSHEAIGRSLRAGQPDRVDAGQPRMRERGFDQSPETIEPASEQLSDERQTRRRDRRHGGGVGERFGDAVKRVPELTVNAETIALV